jgi:hypothetical protein
MAFRRSPAWAMSRNATQSFVAGEYRNATLKRKIEQQREGPTAAFQTAEDAPVVDAKIAIARLTSQKLAEAIRSRSDSYQNVPSAENVVGSPRNRQ